MPCITCDANRTRQGTPQLVGKPCDVCNDTGVDYLGRYCSHLPHNEKKGMRHEIKKSESTSNS